MSDARFGANGSVKPSIPANDNPFVRTLAVWQPRLGRNVSHEDARQILENATGFFKILAEWSRDGMPDPANENDAQLELRRVEDEKRGRTGAADDGEQGRSRP